MALFNAKKSTHRNPFKASTPKNTPLAKTGITELVFILDRSGSMSGLESDTIGGFNSVLAQHKKESGQAKVTTVLFDNYIDVLHDRVDIANVDPLTENDYQVRGCTALLDALGQTLEHIDQVQSYLPEDHRAEHVIFVVTTDGLENASRHFDRATIKRMIEAKTELGWEFFFLGANIDAVEEAGSLGISEDRSATYLADSEGSAVMYGAIAHATVASRKSKSRINGTWKHEVEADTCKRGK